MLAALLRPPPTLADLFASLGGVPIDRIWTPPLPGSATEFDMVRKVEAADKRLVELIDGTLVEKASSQQKSRLICHLMAQVCDYCHEYDLGAVCGPDCPVRMCCGNVRLPEGCVFPFSAYPDFTIPDENVASLAPRLAVEVTIDTNTVAEVAKKLGELFASGTTLAWVLDLDTRTTEVYTTATDFTPLDTGDTLDGGDILPGFVCPLGDLFEEASRRSARKKAP